MHRLLRWLYLWPARRRGRWLDREITKLVASPNGGTLSIPPGTYVDVGRWFFGRVWFPKNEEK